MSHTTRIRTRSSVLAVAGLAAVLVGAPAASAQSTLDILRTTVGTDLGIDAGAGMPDAPVGQKVNAPTGNKPARVGGGGAGTVTALPVAPARRATTRCTTRRAVRTCTTIRPNSAVTRVCVTRAGRTRCRNGRRPAATVARAMSAGTLTQNGFLNQTIAQVGKIYFPSPKGGTGFCSGTVVGVNLVLTAGHCLSTNGVYHGNVTACGSGQGQCIAFVPGASRDSTDDYRSLNAPYGVWTARAYWVPTGWLNGQDPALDWGLIEIAPNSQGQNIGDVVGAWPITYDYAWPEGTRAFMVGYPGVGYWRTNEAGNGRNQYFCDTSTSNEQWRNAGSGYELFAPCYMNGGASGGPWFAQDANGKWSIVGVSNRCWGPNMNSAQYCEPYSYSLRSSYFDDRFIEFWNSVMPLVGR